MYNYIYKSPDLMMLIAKFLTKKRKLNKFVKICSRDASLVLQMWEHREKSKVNLTSILRKHSELNVPSSYA